MPYLSNTDVRDIETLLHPTTNLVTHRSDGPLVIDRGEGVYVFDTRGKRYIEGLAGLWCTSLGYGNKEIADAAHAQMMKLGFSHLFGGRSHEPAIELAEKLKEMVPVPTSKIFFTSSGSEANDTQIKLAWYYNNARGKPNKKKIISRKRAYHGVTIASASLTGLPVFHNDFDLPMARVLHAETPHHYRGAEPGESEEDFATRLAAQMQDMIERENPDTIAAFIAEPVMGAGGVIVPPKTYFEKLQKVLARHDIAMISDEVICGFGRTGSMFGCETLNYRANTLSMAKAITSAHMPLGAITVTEPLYQALLEESKKLGVFAHGFTYSGHPVACAVALKVLEIYERIDIVARVREVAPVFETRLRGLADHPLVGEARGVGLIGALELVADKTTKKPFDPKLGLPGRIVRFAEAEGLICRAIAGDAIALCPPLIIRGSEVNEMFDCLTRALDKGLDWLTAEKRRG